MRIRGSQRLVAGWSGRRFRRARVGAGATLDEVGGRLGVDKATLSRWERGRILPPMWIRVRLAEEERALRESANANVGAYAR